MSRRDEVLARLQPGDLEAAYDAGFAAAEADARRGREIAEAFLPVMEAMRPFVLNYENLKDHLKHE